MRFGLYSDEGDKESLHSGPTPLGRGASEAAATEQTTELSKITASIVLILISSLGNLNPAAGLEIEQVGIRLASDAKTRRDP